jgi:chromosome segregation ATPase
MKRNIFFCLTMLLLASMPALCQKYRTTADTVNLNKEYVKVSNDIADLQARLTIAQNNLPGYQSKANVADQDAEHAAENSSSQAFKATNGSVSDARSAKRKAKKAYSEAKDARSAKNNVNTQDDKIESLSKQLNKKQQRLQELTEMRTAISLL